MVKKGYYGNECFGLARDCIEVRQMNPFITTYYTPYIITSPSVCRIIFILAVLFNQYFFETVPCNKNNLIITKLTCIWSASAKLRALHTKNVLTYQRVLHAYVLTCKHILHAYVLTWQPVSSTYVPHVSTCLASLCTYVSTCLVSSRAPVPTCFESLVSYALRHHVINCQYNMPCLLRIFDATFFSFTAIVVEAVHTAGKTWLFN